MSGWIKIHRKITDWGWYQDDHTFRVFMHLLFTANYEDREYMGHQIPRGSAVTGYYALAETLAISVQNARTAISHLKSTGEVTVKVTSKFSIVTLVKYEDYQITDDEVTSKSTSKLTSIQQASNKHLTASKEYKNKELKKEKEESTIVLSKKADFEIFWEKEIEENKDKKYGQQYKQLYDYIIRKKAYHLLKFRDPLMYEEFEQCIEWYKKNGLKLHVVVDEMMNKPQAVAKNFSFNLTLRSWGRIRLNGKFKNNK